MAIDMVQLKFQLYDQCLAYAQSRIETAQSAISAARESANEDTKSSAGDKYETGRAMMQQEIDRHSLQLLEARKLKQLLEQIKPEHESDNVQAGSLVITNQGAFYIAVSAGTLSVNGHNYYAISALSPIGARLLRQKEGLSFEFNHKTYVIENIY